MIITTRKGRKKSVTTDGEMAAHAGDLIDSLTEEETALVMGLISDDPDMQTEYQKEMFDKLYCREPVSMEQFIEDPHYLGESCSTVYPELKKDLIALFDYPFREVVLTGAIGVGKCASRYSDVVHMTTGERMTVEEAFTRGIDDGCATFDHVAGRTVNSKCRIMQSGMKKIGHLVLGSGKKVGLTPDHPVLTPWGYKPVGELKRGDLVATSREMPAPEMPLVISDNEVKWVGYLLADGSCTAGTLGFTKACPAIVGEVKDLTVALGGKIGYEYVTGETRQFSMCGMMELRAKFDLNHKSKDKRIPSEFYGLGDRQLALLLNRIWSCDGWFCRRGKGEGNWEAGIALASEPFVKDIQQLLLRFGIHSRMRPREMGYTYNGEKKHSDAWSLQVLGRDEIIRFLDSIGNLVGKEDDCETARRELEFVKGNSNVDITPMNNDVMISVRREIGPVSREAYWPRPAQGSQMGHGVFLKFAEAYELPEWCSWWGGVFWDDVKSYECGDELEPVYDIEVPGTRNFAVHGIIVHNTYVLSIAVCRVLYELSCLVNPQKTFGLSSGTEMVIPLISKNLPLARAVMKSAVDDKIKESPYFMNEFYPKISIDSTLFPNNIRLIVGSYGSERILGSNVFCAALDECCNAATSLGILTIGGVSSVTIGELLEMDPEDAENCKVVGFDHAENKLKAGWWRIKKSTVQELVEIKTARGSASPSRKHPVLVRKGDWLVYVHAEDVVPGDFVVMEDRDAVEGREVWSSQEEGDELKFAGVRPERTHVKEIPSGLCLTEVVSVSDLPAEQTYSLCTEFQTFIADGFVVHNTNFPPNRKTQQITTAMGQKKTKAHFDIVEKVYRSLVRRIKSRFQVAGGDFPGMIILASSAATLDSFTERKIRESRLDSSVFVRDHTQWTAKPESNFCGEKFWVLCSSSSMRSRIMEEDDIGDITDEWLEENDSFLLDIPIEYKSDFEMDIENALRDLAGLSTQAISIYIQRPDAVDACISDEMEHPFSAYEWTSGQPGAFDWGKLCTSFDRRLPGGYTEQAWVPIINPSKLRWCHIDTSLSGDCTGFCVGHIDRWVEVIRRDGDGNRYHDMAPFYIIDVMLRINPPPGEQIYMPDLRRFIYELQMHGYQFLGFSSDTYQSAEMHQQIKRRGIKTHILSTDTSTDPYDELKRSMYENRVRYYHYEPFIEEIKALEYDRNMGKIDHQQAGSKDVADSVAGVVYGLMQGSTKIPAIIGDAKSAAVANEHDWVSPMIITDGMSSEELREMKEAGDTEVSEYVPIVFGD